MWENTDQKKLRIWTHFIHDIKLTTKSFDKRDYFLFYINAMHYLDGNMPSKIFFASVNSDILRIAKTKTDLINKVTRILLIRMKKQGS